MTSAVDNTIQRLCLYVGPLMLTLCCVLAFFLSFQTLVTHVTYS